MYTVQVNDPPPLYGIGYFPRKFRYKKKAIECAKAAIANGATMARVECPGGGEIDYRLKATTKKKKKAVKIRFSKGHTVTYNTLEEAIQHCQIIYPDCRIDGDPDENSREVERLYVYMPPVATIICPKENKNGNG
jgi:hypothetical protein